MLWILWLLLIAIFLVLLFYLLSIWNYFSILGKIRKNSKFSPELLPFNYGLGQFIDFLRPDKMEDYYREYTAVAEKSNGVCIASFFGSPYLLSHDPEFIKQVSVVHASKFPKTPQFYQELKATIGNGLVTSDGELWKRERGLINPIFTHQNIKTMVDEMKEITLKSVEKFAKKSKLPVDFTREMSLLTLEVIIRCAFGEETDPLEVSEWWAAIDKDFMNYIFALFMIPKSVMDILPFFKSMTSNLHKMKDFIKKLIEKKKEKGPDRTLLSLLINTEHNGEKIEPELLMAESLTFLLAGHETTSTLLSWTAYELCKNPEIQEKAYNEVTSILKDNDLKYENIEEMKYIKNILNETLRLHPPVPEVDKVATEDIKIGDLFIPKGTNIGFNIYGLHTSDKIWKNGQTFDPDRWDEDNIKKIPNFRYTFLPFSVGSRDCVGKLFTQTEAPLILAYLLKNFVLEFSKEFKGLVIDASLTMKPKSLSINMIPRNLQ